jgi:hypothetical protein
MLSLVIFSFISGGLVTWLGYYMPFIVIGAAILTIGTGLMTTFTVTQAVWRTYGYTIIAGAGCGLAMQNAFMSVGAVLPQSTLAVGNAMIMFTQTLSYPSHSSTKLISVVQSSSLYPNLYCPTVSFPSCIKISQVSTPRPSSWRGQPACAT